MMVLGVSDLRPRRRLTRIAFVMVGSLHRAMARVWRGAWLTAGWSDQHPSGVSGKLNFAAVWSTACYTELIALDW
jgi:hypothetical protein